MDGNRLRPCHICGELFSEYKLEAKFTGRRVYICETCMKEGRKEVLFSINSNYVRRKSKEERK